MCKRAFIVTLTTTVNTLFYKKNINFLRFTWQISNKNVI